MKAQPAPPPVQAAPPPAPPPPAASKDNSIGFAISKAGLTLSVMLSIVLAMLIYVCGFLTALALIFPTETPEADITAAAPAATVSALPPTEKVPDVSAAAPVAQAGQVAQEAPQIAPAPDQPKPQSTVAPSGNVSTAEKSEVASDAMPPRPAPRAANTEQARGNAEARAAPPPPPPVPARLADATNLVRSAEGRLSLTPRPSLPPAPIAVRRATEAAAAAAAADTATPRPAEPPAVIAEAKQLPSTRENALLTPPPEKPKPAGDLRWTLQAGAFLSSDHAERLVEILSAKGHDAHILQTADNRDRIWYRVRFGSYNSQASAREAATAFKRKEGRDAIVVRRLITPAPAGNG